MRVRVRIGVCMRVCMRVRVRPFKKILLKKMGEIIISFGVMSPAEDKRTHYKDGRAWKKEKDNKL